MQASCDGVGDDGGVEYEVVAEAYRDLELASGRLMLIDRLATLLAETPQELLPTVCYLCQGQVAPEFAGVDLGLAEKMALRAVATATGVEPEVVVAAVRESGDLGQAAEQLLATTAADRKPSLQVAEVVDTLHEIAGSAGSGSQGRKLEFLSQEMFREINTIGSKANNVAIARCVVEMKAAVEKMREILQNVE